VVFEVLLQSEKYHTLTVVSLVLFMRVLRDQGGLVRD
jgi:hypothetical protein